MAVLTCNYCSGALSGAQCFSAVLPADIQPRGFGPAEYRPGPFPTLYLLHGFGGDHNDWLMKTRVQEWSTANGWAVIMPDGRNSFYLDHEDTGVRWGEMVGSELVEVTRKLFPLSHKREDTAIGGLSMGGFGALRTGFRYAQTFGHIAAMSAALITEEVSRMTPGTGNVVAPYGFYRNAFGEPAALIGSDNDPKALAKKLAGTSDMPRVFIACGTEDTLHPFNLDMHEYLESIGCGNTFWSRPGRHDFAFWDAALWEVGGWLKKKD